MPVSRFMSSDAIRSTFSAAMSAMYRDEVPAYGTLMELVADINAATLEQQPGLRASLEATRLWTGSRRSVTAPSASAPKPSLP